MLVVPIGKDEGPSEGSQEVCEQKASVDVLLDIFGELVKEFDAFFASGCEVVIVVPAVFEVLFDL